MTWTCNTVVFVFRGLLSGIMCLVGLFGNALSMTILYRIGGTSVTYFLLRTLAVVDTVYLLAYIAPIVVPEFFYFFGTGMELTNAYQYVILGLYPVASMALTATVWVTMLVTAHRYVSISRPMEKFALFTMRGAVLEVTAVVFFSVLVDVPKYFEREIITVQIDNATFIQVMTTTSLWKDDVYQLVYKNIAMIGFRKILPIAITFILTVLLVRLLVKRKKRRQKLFSNVTRDQDPKQSEQLSYILISIASMLIFCQTPMSIYPLLRLVFDISSGCDQFYHYFANVADWLGVVNSAANFFIYYPAVPSFRQQLLHLFTVGKKGDDTDHPSQSGPASEGRKARRDEVMHTSVNNTSVDSRM